MTEYRRLSEDEICQELFNGFIRRQEVTKCWRKVSTGGFVYAAFYNGVLKGFVSVEAGLSGGKQKYLDLSSIHVKIIYFCTFCC